MLLNDREFLAAVGAVFASQGNVMHAYEGLRPDLMRMIGLIDVELGN